MMAESYSNSAHIGFFACCREAWDHKKHSGCVPGPLANAIEQFAAKDLEKLKQAEKQTNEVERLKLLLKQTQDKVDELEKAKEIM